MILPTLGTWFLRPGLDPTSPNMCHFSGAVLEGSRIEVVLAKPVDKQDYVRYTRGGGRGVLTQVKTVYIL